MSRKRMLNTILQAQDQSERLGQGIAYIGGSSLTMLAAGIQNIPSASPWVIDAAMICGACVVVGRFVLDVLKWWDRRAAERKGKDR